MNRQQQTPNPTIRQITPEEVAKAQGITVEEFQKTQVLNLKELEEAVRIEKLTSKKPAIIVGVCGLFLIMIGLSFQLVTTLQSKSANKVSSRRIMPEDRIQEEMIKTTLQCQKLDLNNPDGTNKTFTINYSFEDDKLVGFTKNFHVQIIPDNPNGPVRVQNYLNAYKDYMNPIPGYAISVQPLNDGLEVNVEVNYNQLDLTKLNLQQQQHFSTKVDYPLDTAKEKIEQDMVNDSYTCQ